jgi:hypothetical protein
MNFQCAKFKCIVFGGFEFKTLERWDKEKYTDK